MQKFKEVYSWISESCLFVSVIFYWISTSAWINPVAILLLALLSALFAWKNAILGIIISFLFLILGLIMIVALLSELSEFATFNKDARLMTAIGATWSVLTIISGIGMLTKWGANQSQRFSVIENQDV